MIRKALNYAWRITKAVVFCLGVFFIGAVARELYLQAAHPKMVTLNVKLKLADLTASTTPKEAKKP